MSELRKKLVELEVTDLAFDGKSVAHQEGKVVFLRGGLPGETVLAEITRQKPRYNEGIVKEIVGQSDMRTPPICSHFDISLFWVTHRIRAYPIQEMRPEAVFQCDLRRNCLRL